MKISRFVGTTNQTIGVFIQDATVSTGAGLANINASSVSFAWHREGMAAVSSGTCTTGTLGTYGASSFVQKSSTLMLGWYEFGAPPGLFAAGGYVNLHMYGAPSMAPLPIEIDISTQVAAINTAVGVSTVTIPVGVSSISTPVAASSLSVGVNASTVSDKAGYGVSSISVLAGVSTLTTPVTVSSGVVSVSTVTIPVGVSTVATLLGVSTLTIPVGVSSITTPVAASSLSVGVNVSSINAVPIIGTGIASDLWRA